MFKSLKRITYFVDDIEKAKQWYSMVLETPPIFDTPFAAIYNFGGCSLSLAKAKNPLAEVNGRMDVYWEVDDIDSAFATFVHHGARIQTPVKKVLNIRVAQLIDPFGNVIGLTGDLSKPEDRTVEKQPSETAMSVAFSRALASKDDRTELKGPDDLAEIFLNDEAKRILHDGDSRKWAVQNLVKSPLYGYFIARTAFMDSIFLDACENDIPQIVFLGAGYDTRAYRFIDKLKNTKIFELDIETTQRRKREALQKNGVTIPGSLSFVPINFKTENIYDVLSKAGYDDGGKTLFIWEGVTYYLTRGEVEKTLRFVREYSAAGSLLCFDYMTTKLESFNPSEPFRFWDKREGMEELLANFGIKMVEHLDSTEMKKRYLTLRDGTTAESVMPALRLVKAVVEK